MIQDDTVTVQPDSFAYGGAAVATLSSGKRCFIRGGVPGDELRVRIVSDRKKFSSAEIKEIIHPASSRITPVCPLAGKCPGCVYSHVDYQTELEWKQKQFLRFMKSANVSENLIKPPVPAPERTGWRTKIKLTRDHSGRTGYLAWDNKTIIPVEKCFLADPMLADMIRNNRAFSGEPDGRGRETLTFRCTEKDGAVCVGKKEKQHLLNWELPGFEPFRIPAGSFCQINTVMAAKLIRTFVAALQENTCECFTELYCGSGIFSIAAGKAGAKKCFGIELDPIAVKAARLNAEKTVPGKCRFIAGDAAELYLKNPAYADTILVDPPRTGLDKRIALLLAQKPPHRLFYVSCGPDTLARDIPILTAGGRLHVRSAQLFDLFPSTAHFESLIELTDELP